MEAAGGARTVEVGGATIGFDDHGSGDCLLLTHSFLCSRRMWAMQAAALGRQYRVINVDLPGHGESPLGSAPLTLGRLADDLVAVLDACEVDRATWIGLSIGGMLSLRAAVEHPERVAALVIADSDGGRDPWWKRARYRAMAAGARRLGIERFLPAVAGLMFGATSLETRSELVERWLDDFRAVPMATIDAGVRALNRRPSVLDRLREVDVPALVLVGEEDRAQPPEGSRKIAQALRRATLEVVPGAGHLSAVERPERVLAAIERFLATLD